MALTSFLLGSASGLAIELLGNDTATAIRALAVSVGLAALLTAATSLRRIPPRARIARYGVGFLHVSGLAALITAASGPPGLTPYAIFIAVAFAGATLLVATDVEARLAIALAAALIGFGAALVSLGISAFSEGDVLAGVLCLGFGLSGVSAGITTLVGPAPLQGVSALCAGITFGIAGVALLAGRGDSDFGVPLLGLGLASATLGVSVMIDSGRAHAVGQIGAGAVLAGTGVMLVTRSDLALGLPVLTSGLSLVGLAIFGLIGRRSLASLTFVVNGVSLVAMGALWSREGALLLAVAYMGFGLAGASWGVVSFIDNGGISGVKRWLMAEPSHHQSKGPIYELTAGNSGDGSLSIPAQTDEHGAPGQRLPAPRPDR